MKNYEIVTGDELSTREKSAAIRKSLVPKHRLPLNFDPASLPDLTRIPSLLTRPVWHGSAVTDEAWSIREDLLRTLHTMNDLRMLFDRGWLSTDDVRAGLSHLLAHNFASLTELVGEDARRLGIETPLQFAYFQQTGVLHDCPISLVPEGARKLMEETVGAANTLLPIHGTDASDTAPDGKII